MIVNVDIVNLILDSNAEFEPPVTVGVKSIKVKVSPKRMFA